MPKEQHSEQEIISALKQYESGERKAVTLLRLKVERIDLGGSKIAKQQGHVVRSQTTPPRSKVRKPAKLPISSTCPSRIRIRSSSRSFPSVS